MEEYLEYPDCPRIHDRIPCISEKIYGPIIRGADTLGSKVFIDQIIEMEIPIIYCRPPTTILFNKPITFREGEEDPAHVAKVIEQHCQICAAYDQAMADIPHLSWDWYNSSPNHLTTLALWVREYFKRISNG